MRAVTSAGRAAVLVWKVGNDRVDEVQDAIGKSILLKPVQRCTEVEVQEQS
jgi:hypothetical protein